MTVEERRRRRSQACFESHQSDKGFDAKNEKILDCLGQV
jgi:hypothetical protein